MKTLSPISRPRFTHIALPCTSDEMRSLGQKNKKLRTKRISALFSRGYKVHGTVHKRRTLLIDEKNFGPSIELFFCEKENRGSWHVEGDELRIQVDDVQNSVDTLKSIGGIEMSGIIIIQGMKVRFSKGQCNLHIGVNFDDNDWANRWLTEQQVAERLVDKPVFAIINGLRIEVTTTKIFIESHLRLATAA